MRHGHAPGTYFCVIIGSAMADRGVHPFQAAAHRREAFAACMDLVDEVKRRLPVWKRQVFTDGSDEWVGSA